MTTNRLELIPTNGHDGFGPVIAYPTYTVCDTWAEVLSRATAWGHCLTYKARSGRWVLKTIEYVEVWDEDEAHPDDDPTPR